MPDWDDTKHINMGDLTHAMDEVGKRLNGVTGNLYNFTLERLSTPTTGYAATYILKKNGLQEGDAINIPKDYLVKSGSVETVITANTPYTGAVSGDKYLDFVVNTPENDASTSHIYIPVNDLVDVYTNATTTIDGLMSASDKTKLDGIATGANNYTHPSYTAQTGKPEADQTPSFGGTFTVSQVASDFQGHVSSMTDRTVRIPDSVATSSNKGLMSAADKAAHDKAVQDIGTMSNLLTTEKGSLVGAVNELHTALSVDVMKALREASGAGIHNALYRGKALGGTFTTAQQNAIDDGSFEDLFVGNHWDFTNVSYTWTDDENQGHNDVYSGTFRILDCDYLLRSGDRECTTHHLMVAPDANLFNHAMNPTNDTTGAYAGSEMRTKNSGLARARAIFEACFGAGTLMPHRVYLQNAVTNGKPSAGAWMDSLGAELMTEEQVYGSPIFDSGVADGVIVYNRYTIGCKQFNFFRHSPDMISKRQWYWLQNVVSAYSFAGVSTDGVAATGSASFSEGGVRPVFALRKAA